MDEISNVMMHTLAYVTARIQKRPMTDLVAINKFVGKDKFGCYRYNWVYVPEFI